MNEVIFTHNLIAELQKYRPSISSWCIIVDENTRKFCLPQLGDLFEEKEIIKIKSGEKNKNIQTCEYIWEKMTELGLDRGSMVVNLGGGVIGDMGGFCAATYKRGIDFIQIPTTLLSQVDASVGGKLGIDFLGYKNQIGVFAEPKVVIINPDFLKTLEQRQVLSGFAEIIKHYLIADKNGWEKIRGMKDLDGIDWLDIIQHSVAIKTSVVEGDPRESGKRKILNFGHTVGHAVESYLLPDETRRLLHGEAVAAGMICEGYLSWQSGLLSENDFNQIRSLISHFFPRVVISDQDIDLIAPLALQDKKNKGEDIMCVLLDGIGSARYDAPVTLEHIRESLRYYKKYVSS